MIDYILYLLCFGSLGVGGYHRGSFRILILLNCIQCYGNLSEKIYGRENGFWIFLKI